VHEEELRDGIWVYSGRDRILPVGAGIVADCRPFDTARQLYCAADEATIKLVSDDANLKRLTRVFASG
jgi:hypothetical protein